MDRFQKLSLLSENMDVEDGESIEHSLSQCPSKKKVENHPIITHAKMSGGKTIPLLKSVITSVCERNCNYCAFRAGSDFRRATFTPDEMATTFLDLYNKDIAKGLFLSSGIAGGGIRVQEKIIDTAEILRKKKKFQGYLHLKIMPGAEFDQIEYLMRWADRVSINLEAPNPERLSFLAPKKNFGEELFTRLKWVESIRKKQDSRLNWKGRWPSLTTQLVVGPSGENDIEILKTSEYLISHFHLSRIYYMTFRPVAGTPFENFPAENPLRGHRLYQASFLVRDYGYSFEDFEFSNSGNLALHVDPKMYWAEKYLCSNPIELNFASKEELLRVPGIGPKRVELIAKYRRSNKIKSENDLEKLGIPVEKVAKFVLLNGKQPIHQLKFSI
ncbi:MAG TPA: radical SAM protein [Anaerolineaceae bacterium]|nr:radical SAM protein [Anaerolineaceae bacterium]